MGRQRLQRRQQEMRAVDIGVQRGELVVERVADEALGRQVIALVGLHFVDHPVHAGIAFERRGMQYQAAADSLSRESRWSGSSSATRRTMPWTS